MNVYLEWPIHFIVLYLIWKCQNLLIVCIQWIQSIGRVELFRKCYESIWFVDSKLKQSAWNDGIYGINIWCNIVFIFFVPYLSSVSLVYLLLVHGFVYTCYMRCVEKWYTECKTVFENYLNISYVIKLTNNNNCDRFLAVTSAMLSYGILYSVIPYTFFSLSLSTDRFKYKKVSTLTACHHSPCNRQVENIHEK